MRNIIWKMVKVKITLDEFVCVSRLYIYILPQIVNQLILQSLKNKRLNTHQKPDIIYCYAKCNTYKWFIFRYKIPNYPYI